MGVLVVIGKLLLLIVGLPIGFFVAVVLLCLFMESIDPTPPR